MGVHHRANFEPALFLDEDVLELFGDGLASSVLDLVRALVAQLELRIGQDDDRSHILVEDGALVDCDRSFIELERFLCMVRFTRR